MKLSFKIVATLLIFQINNAREIVVFSYKEKTQSTEFLLKQLQEEVTPKLLSIFIKDEPCSDIYKDAILHMCVDENHEVKIIRQNIEVLKRSISKL